MKVPSYDRTSDLDIRIDADGDIELRFDSEISIQDSHGNSKEIELTNVFLADPELFFAGVKELKKEWKRNHD